jgi:acyl-CoA reductase-like NAD-dependent aldehyde dehydrogenase
MTEVHDNAPPDCQTAVFGGLEWGHWVAPTIFDRIVPAIRVVHKEIFGRVLSVIRGPDAEVAFEAAKAKAVYVNHG